MVKKLGNDLAARNDSYNWNVTLNKAMEQHPEIDFLVSPGDQVSVKGNEDAKRFKRTRRPIFWISFRLCTSQFTTGSSYW